MRMRRGGELEREGELQGECEPEGDGGKEGDEEKSERRKCGDGDRERNRRYRT